MTRRRRPLFESLTYDKAPEADSVMRPQAAELPSRTGTMHACRNTIAPSFTSIPPVVGARSSASLVLRCSRGSDRRSDAAGMSLSGALNSDLLT